MPNNVVTGTNNDVSLIMSYLPLPCSYNDAGLDVTLDNRTVLTCAEFWQPLGKRSGEGAAAHAGSIEGSRRGGQSYEPQYDFVGGGLSDEGDTRADKEVNAGRLAAPVATVRAAADQLVRARADLAHRHRGHRP